MRRCDLKHMLGIPHEGVHKTRIGDAAFWDVFFTLCGAYLAHAATQIPLVVCTITAFVVGELLHWYFCVETATQKWLLSFVHSDGQRF